MEPQFRRNGVVHDLPVELLRLDVDAVQVVAATHTELKGTTSIGRSPMCSAVSDDVLSTMTVTVAVESGFPSIGHRLHQLCEKGKGCGPQ